MGEPLVIVAGHFDVDPARRDEFIAGRRQAMETSRSEEGCITYVFSADPLDDARVHLFERWASKEALGAHLAAMRAASRPPSDVPILTAEIQQFEISRIGAVGS